MLTKEQIKILFTFCEKHFVHFYEVQVELVDHLANAIELEMRENEHLSFESALEKVYARFGVMGFVPMVNEKARQVEKHYSKKYWQLVRNQFGWPQILLFLTLSLSYYSIATRFELAALIVLIIILLAGETFAILNARSLSSFLKRSGKKFLSTRTYLQSSTSWLPLYFLVQFLVRTEYSTLLTITLSLVVGLYFLLLLVAHQLNKQIRRNLIQSFPEAFPIAQ